MTPLPPVASPPLASIPSPPFNVLEIGPLDLHVYGLLIAIGVALAFKLGRRRWEARGGDGELADRILLWAVIAGLLGARAGYVTTHLDTFQGRPWAVLFIWEGGLAFFGGLAFGAATAVWLLRRHGQDVAAFADSVVVGIPLAQAVGRWGNYFNQELFGTPSTLPWAVEIDRMNRPARYADAATFHPTFLYESLYNLVVVAVLLQVEKRFDLRRGSLMILYLGLYGVGRFLLELLRTDTTFRLLGLSRNGWIALALTVGATVVLVRRQRRPATDDEAVSEHAGS